MGHDVVSVTVAGADVAATEDALSGLAGLERVVAERERLALYVEDGAASIDDICAGSSATRSAPARSPSSAPRLTMSSSRRPPATSKARRRPLKPAR